MYRKILKIEQQSPVATTRPNVAAQLVRVSSAPNLHSSSTA